jgi:hypothetical protein
MNSIDIARAPSLVATVLLALTGPVQAQVSTEEVARRLVGEGIEAAKARDWITARDRFAQAYEIQPLPLTLYNLAAAQEKTGDLVSADRGYRVFLRETSPGEYDDFRAAAGARREALRKRIAYVVLEAPNLVRTDILRVDDSELAHAVLGQAVPANPGPLRVEVEREGRIVAARELEVAEGASTRVKLEVPPFLAAPTAVEPPPPRPAAVTEAPRVSERVDDDAGGGVLESGWFWAAVGVLAVSGAGVGAYFALRPDDPYPSSIERITISGR